MPGRCVQEKGGREREKEGEEELIIKCGRININLKICARYSITYEMVNRKGPAH